MLKPGHLFQRQFHNQRTPLVGKPFLCLTVVLALAAGCRGPLERVVPSLGGIPLPLEKPAEWADGDAPWQADFVSRNAPRDAGALDPEGESHLGQDDAPPLPPPTVQEEPLPAPDDPPPEPILPGRPRPLDDDPDAVRRLLLDDVEQSVVAAYPQLRASYEGQQVADGETLAAAGAFDLLIRTESRNQPLGFYENFRHAVTLEQPLYHGGSAFAGYRIGRGHFEPWYKGRDTNDGGEFGFGVMRPLVQNSHIDPRRAELWRRQWESRAVEPAVRADVLTFVFEASLAYWFWVGEGQNVRVSEALLQLAHDRQAGLERQVEEGELPRIDLVDNQRLIVSRDANLIAARQRLQEAAVRLALFLRDPLGQPALPDENALPREFPPLPPECPQQEQEDVLLLLALQYRPELEALEYARRQLEIDLRQAHNLALPEVDAYVLGSQDVGGHSTPARDKGRFELEAGIVGSMPLQRRRAAGKTVATEARLAQLAARRQFAADQIVADVRNAHIALAAIRERVDRARESVELAAQMREAEHRRWLAGDSDLLMLNFRETQEADAAFFHAQTLRDYFQAEAAYRAALGITPLASAGGGRAIAH